MSNSVKSCSYFPGTLFCTNRTTNLLYIIYYIITCMVGFTYLHDVVWVIEQYHFKLTLR